MPDPSLDPVTTLFELRAGPLGAGELTVLSFDGREAMSRPFRFDITFASALDLATITASLLDQPAELALAVPGAPPRRVRGVVARVGSTGERDEQGLRRYRLRLVPSLSRLRRRKNSRIYQDLSVIAVVARVLDEHRVVHRVELVRRYKPRAYCVQYQETDLAFVTRLLAEDGLFFFFEADGAAERLVIGDSPSAYAPIASLDGEGRPGAPPVVPFHAVEGVGVAAEQITRFSIRAGVQPSAVRHHDYDFERPLLDLTVSTADPRPGGDAPEAAREALDGSRLAEFYEHHGDHSNVDDALDRADLRLSQLRRRARTSAGEGTSRRLAAGHVFRLDGHGEPGADGDWALTRVEHRGVAPAQARSGGAGEPVYTCRFEAVPASVPYRPALPRQRQVHSIESAVVVGPEREVIHTDAYGRVKVEFHWDREGRRDDRSSCWLRVSQAWAGTGWGFQFLPRVGMEVLVGFLGGDPDRPIVLGTMYNRVNMPPFPLPADKTRSGIRTSSAGGSGYNELSFQDESGREQIRLRAERDLDEEIEHDHTSVVRGDRAMTVAGAQTTEIAGPSRRSFHGGRSTFVGEDDGVTVAGRAILRCEEREVTIAGARRETVGGASTTRVEGLLRVEAEGDLVTQVAGDHRLTVGVEGDRGHSATFVHGALSLSSTRSIALRADAEITLTVGETLVRLTPDKLEALGKALHLAGREETFVAGGKPSIHLRDGAEITAETITLFSSGASLELTDSEARLGGSKVKLGKPVSASPRDASAPPDPEKKTVRWRFTDAAHAPYAGKTYHLLVEGLRIEGKTDGDGALLAEIPKDASSAEVLLWIGEYPTGERRRYPVVIADALPDAASPEGARVRMHALGYDVGLGHADPWPAFRAAVNLFQTRHRISDGLKATGELDDATKAAIARVFGA
ncbi:MAG: type VI secretion system tip protein TssI/VgrG [Byssovorax sp.]